MPTQARILLVSDGVSDEGEAIRQALNQARSHGAQLDALVLCPEFPKALAEHQASYGELLREKVHKDVQAAFAGISVEEHEVPVAIDVQVTSSPVVDTVRRVLRNEYALLVKQAAQSPGRSGFLAVDMDLLRKCPCPVWLAKTIERPRQDIKVAAAIDPETTTEAARALSVQLLLRGRELADECDGVLHILSCWDFPQEDWLRSKVPGSELANAATSVQRQHRQQLETRILEAGIAGTNRIVHARGQAGQVLPRLVADLGIDILAMGTVARTGIPGWLMGNTAENVFHDLSCSLLALKPNGYVSPIKAY